MIALGIAGKKGAGKTAAAQYLERTYGFKIMPMAAPLKKMMMAMGLTADQVYGKSKEVPCAELNGRTPRHAMQTLGTEWGRMMIDEDLWVNRWQSLASQHNGPVVADDVRNENEFKAIRAVGGKILRLLNPALVSNDAHPSEMAADLLEVDYSLVNPGTSLVALHTSLDHAIKHLRLGR